MNKSIVLIHGHGPQPAALDLEALWQDAIAAGLRRDRAKLVPALDTVDLQMVYYADAFPSPRGKEFDSKLDLADLQRTLKTLSALDKPRRFRRQYYDELPGKSALKEFIADVGVPLARSVGLGSAALNRLFPESTPYWDVGSNYAVTLQDRVIEVLAPLLHADRTVLLIAHGFGSIVAYDALWRLSHEFSPPSGSRLHTLLTLGSPLADNGVRARLLGSGEAENRRYPTNLTFWHNIAAEDDAVCHDESVQNDFAAMLKSQRLSAIEDHLIYNLAVRYGRSDPHCCLGYLIHPKTISLIADWLEH